MSNNGQQFPYLELYVNNSGTGTTVDDALFFEPPYQAPGTGGNACAHQAATAMNTWQQWDALSGCWWDNNGVLGGGGTNTSPLSAYLAAYPNATIVNSGTGGGVHLVVGFASSNDQFDGYVDAFRIATSSSDTTYNFEPTPPIVTPKSKDDCKKDGWKNVTRADGSRFKNQGDCIQYVNTGK